MVDTEDLKSFGFGRAGSSPAPGTRPHRNSERTLVTGFGAFGAFDTNPSAELARHCGRPHALIEVAFAAVDAFLEAIQPDEFDRLLMLGVARKRTHLTPELYARNYVGREPDVRGVVRNGDIEEEGPLLLLSTLWNPGDLSEGLPLGLAHVSLDAGNYLCNYISYRALRRFPEKAIGFLHVPPFDAIDFEQQQDALAQILNAVEALH